MTDDPRVLLAIRLRRSSVEAVDKIAAEHDWNRSTALRALLSLGLKAWNRGER